LTYIFAVVHKRTNFLMDFGFFRGLLSLSALQFIVGQFSDGVILHISSQ